MKSAKGMIIPTVAGVATAAVTMLTKMPMPICILSTAGMWFGSYLLIPEEPAPPKTKQELFNENMEILNDQIRSLSYKEKNIEDKTTSKTIGSIVTSLKGIREAVLKDPSKYDKIRKVFEYYIPLTVEIVEKYDEIEDSRLTSSESKKYMAEVRQNIGLLDSAYKQVINNVYEEDIIDATANVNVLNSLLKMEGLDSEK